MNWGGLGIAAVAIILFLIGMKIAKWIFWGLAILAALFAAWWFLF